MSPGTGAALRLLAASVDAKAVAEIGTGTGVSGIHLLHGMRPDGVLTTVDPEPEHQQFARQAFRACGFASNRARFIPGRALDVLPRLADAGYDLVFCDPGVRPVSLNGPAYGPPGWLRGAGDATAPPPLPRSSAAGVARGRPRVWPSSRVAAPPLDVCPLPLAVARDMGLPGRPSARAGDAADRRPLSPARPCSIRPDLEPASVSR